MLENKDKLLKKEKAVQAFSDRHGFRGTSWIPPSDDEINKFCNQLSW